VQSVRDFGATRWGQLAHLTSERGTYADCSSFSSSQSSLSRLFLVGVPLPLSPEMVHDCGAACAERWRASGHASYVQNLLLQRFT